MSASCAGLVAKSTTRAGGRSVRERTCRPRSVRTPRAVRAPGGAGPVLDGRAEGEDHRDRGGERPLEGQDRMRRQSREQRARALAAEARAKRAGGREEARQSEAGEPERVPRDPQRAEEV